ncbi:glycosyltransferase family 4 protein [Sporosalibacterium faouarense]|uniref:glycosyltransferase family 4 protein n=1 Tax=Sporosalibacterium faouarense TaxID=516123 RepID=UPI00141D4F92|nr:MraY family glycosyltransferase [Sporosalibacterium faouarense]MTI46873.1 undecaprenyl/decaprenyl-phosphate alpha-N-acetylglucosaminyl 1-phosphate transferase [Bacillota bacterium]
MNEFYLPFLTALIISYVVTPFVKWIANKVGAIDVPKDERRVHKVPIPRLGGLAIYISTIVSILLFVKYIDRSIIGIIIGATIIVITGIIDDIKPLSAKTKFLAQILAACVLIVVDVKIDFISNPFDKVDGLTHLGMWSIPVTLFWVIGITNTLNFIDGLDGLAAGVGSISAMSLLFVASVNGYFSIAIIAAILAGSAFGFLPHNFNPAKIFMGDTGALFLGYMLSVLAIKGVMKSVAAIGIAVPILVLGIPIFDTTFAICRRLINKTPPWKADKGHLHHRLLDKGLTQKQTVLILYLISVCLGASAVLINDSDTQRGALILGIVTTVGVIGAIRMGLIGLKRRESIRQKEE